MAKTLYVIQSRAQRDYVCPSCKRAILRGTLHFRHDPYSYAKWLRKEPTTHWCEECVLAASPTKHWPTEYFRVPMVRVMNSPQRLPLRIEWQGIGRILSEKLSGDASLIHKLTPDEFERFICDRLFAMGFEPCRVGSVNKKDGGVDVLFWPRILGAFPVLGAAQIKHHRDPRIKEGPSTVREFAGTVAGHSFNAGMLITNTSFTPDAEWFAREHAKLVRLRGFADIRRWLANNFDDDAEWREIPSILELCPGVKVKIR